MFIRPFVLRAEMSPESTDCGPDRADFRSEWADFRSEMAGLRREWGDFRPKRADFRPERADFRPERANFRPGRADFRPVRADFRPERPWRDAQMDGRTDGWMDEQKSPCVLQDFVPFGAAALLPLTLIHNHAKQGNGYR